MEGVIREIKTNKPGPNLVIMAGVHGNEPCGLDALEIIKDQINITKGSLTLLIGSPKAVEVGKREYETNLNRMFREDNKLTYYEKTTYEYLRSRELMKILDRADALLDIHSSSTTDTEPFIICEPISYDLVQYLPGLVVVSGIDDMHPAGTDAYVNKSGGMGLCIECGNHNDVKATGIALEAVDAFLKYFSNQKNSLEKYEQRKIQATWLYKNKQPFKLHKKYQEFEKISEGSVIGTDGKKKVIAPYDGVIIFPHNEVKKEKEVFVYGKEY